LTASETLYEFHRLRWNFKDLGRIALIGININSRWAIQLGYFGSRSGKPALRS
jgi:hypothetical protein